VKGLAATGVTGLVSAVAAVGEPALVLFGVVLLVAAGVGCWVITSRARTLNTVALIAATRGRATSTAAVTDLSVTSQPFGDRQS
jgi:archaellum component FlaG (FlaF/FlaG flagellin family)